MPGRLRVDWTDALPDLERAADWSSEEATRVVDVIDRMAALGWSPGRPTDEPGVRYLPIPPLGVLYERLGRTLHIVAVIDPRRLRTLP